MPGIHPENPLTNIQSVLVWNDSRCTRHKVTTTNTKSPVPQLWAAEIVDLCLSHYGLTDSLGDATEGKTFV